MNDYITGSIFYSTVFLAFGLGLALEQNTGDMPSGVIFMGVGFVLAILAILINKCAVEVVSE